MHWTLNDARQAVTGSRVTGAQTTAFARVVTDSRSVQPGDLFVAIKGERFDAHDFLADVARAGAAAVVASRVPDGFETPALIVPDTRIALGELAAAWRRRFAIPVVAVTGSNGKTTVKEMISAIFAEAVGAESRLATAGNFNNDIGLPLTLFRLKDGDRLAVLELGMNHPGETAYLARIAQPTVAVINNAQREHQEFMVSVAAVAQEHSAVLAALADDGVAVFPAESEFASMWREIAGKRRVLDFALDARAAVSGRYDVATRVLRVTSPAGEFSLTLPLLGEHNARNALAAIACALGAHVDIGSIVRALEGFSAVKGRLQVSTLSKGPLAGVTLIDDTYNANPDSVLAAIDVLASTPAPRVLVLGDMGEVGDNGPAFHREVGEYAARRGIDRLLAMGELAQASVVAFGDGGQHFSNVDDVTPLVAELNATLSAPATVLVKGSRFMRMERVLEQLRATSESGGGNAPAK
ncbi:MULTISPECIES: UDP-N-acetylmuramoyl-tripeptide--D-alanyl-D-alanine ligase [Pandoraea]|uniref:UDP-N-acetylmuramoyl-tripeptide--D-alanyl-D-alanine ligase n=1 Tax=Pandoraea pnomenusa TaxID=93220 RepID=A0A378YLC8_9BURK|nr:MULTISPECIES: UDP-N-acetylmuramoyl-tripeptide--D-alanyl-D-alanine ligase [Pandoraea]AHB04228.2 UDP-N-acetylmuramoyl-tripeptide--D-alanyl-D-alanine ligase [Pandoraea pnomenusa 3kgm]AHB75381.2 UDP-N-acetylmuramoyl-tripeptide--D-alanyl-D-alanine ligase [Pandoraea pnomenusa]AIU27070.1 UDP-N-acetylmuramoyl-tripeptide--D-alanyl-D-alanine ligase [Pandoraea pnomenusa]ANC47126.1 UDP-N-acetylmuramoyl-tripeptide--D-alanyl-D-alanine ligase [Pandoraea pnomenusa]MBN9091844.1 UDP-N-acetylmuramoyl-tripepti